MALTEWTTNLLYNFLDHTEGDWNEVKPPDNLEKTIQRRDIQLGKRNREQEE